MIENFEEITEELSEAELEILPVLERSFRQRTESNPIKSKDIVEGMKRYLAHHNIPIKMTSVRLRKMVNYIRTNSRMPIIATSKGYYVSYDEETIKSQIRSLKNRANSIRLCADGLKSFI